MIDRQALRTVVEALPAGFSVSLPREDVLALLVAQEAPVGLTVGQAAQLLGRKASTVRGWCQRGELKATRLQGREYRITQADLASFVQRGGPLRTDQPDPTAAPDLGAWRHHRKAS